MKLVLKRLEILFEINLKNILIFYSTFDVRDTCCNFTISIFRKKKAFPDRVLRGVSRLTISFKAYLPI